MNALEIHCAGEALVLLGDKAVFWPRTSSLIVADAHLGKAAAFRSAGIAVPEQVTGADLARLSRLLDSTGAGRLIVLGDLFHARTGMSEAMVTTFRRWRDALSRLRILLLLGNHDAAVGPFPAGWQIETHDVLEEGPFVMSHDRTRQTEHFGLFGHVHPSVHCAGMRLPCFHFTHEFAILPAFGTFTGTHLIRPKRTDRVFVINQFELCELPHALFG